MEDTSEFASLTREIIADADALSNIDKFPFTLEYAFSTLKLTGKSIVDISILSEYPYLTDIDLSENKIEDLSSLSSLCGLRKLKLSCNKLKDTLNYERVKCTSKLVPVSPEEGKSTAWLNGEKDIGSLLEEVHLDHNQIMTISPSLSRHSFITHLNLSHNKIEKIENLNALKYLKSLDLSFNNISRVEGLDANVNLSILNLENNKIQSVENFPSTLTKLSSLILNENQISSFKGLEVCVSLKTLQIKNNRIGAINEVNHLKELKMLHSLSLYWNNEKTNMFYPEKDSESKKNSNDILNKEHYRLRVIHRLPQLQTLDDWFITPEEIRDAHNLQCTGGELQYRKENFENSFPVTRETLAPEEPTLAKFRTEYADWVTPYNDSQDPKE